MERSGFEQFIITVLDNVAHYNSFNDNELWERAHFEKIQIEQMIHEIKNKKRNPNTCNKQNDYELYVMIIKSLALLLFFPQGKNNGLKKDPALSEEELKAGFGRFWENPPDEKEYTAIMKLDNTHSSD